MSFRSLAINKSTKKYLSGLDPKPYKQVVEKVFSLLKDPTPNDSIQMSGSSYHRADIGEHRIIYSFDENTIYILVIDKRNDSTVYKKFKRK